MSSDNTVKIKIVGELDKSFNSALKMTQSALKGLGGVGAAGLKVAGAAIGAAAAGVTALGVSAVKTGSEFESSMSQVAATMMLDKSTAEGAANLKTLEDAARECGRSTAFSASEAAEGLNYLALAGYDADKAAAALPSVLNLAGAGAMDLAAASDMVTDSMSALGIEATQENLESFSDKLAMTASKANASVSQMGEAILAVGGTAKGLKGETTELNTALGILADSGIRGAEGGTHLRNMILSLQNPRNKEAANMMAQLGVNAYTSEGKMRGLNEIFNDINASMEGMNDAAKNNVMSTIFKETDLAAASAMLANSGERWDELSGYIDKAAGAAQDMYDIQLDNLEGDVKKLSSAFDDLKISIFKDVNGPIRDTVQLGTKMLGNISEAYQKGGMGAAVSQMGTELSNGVTLLAQNAPKIIGVATSLVQNFLNGIQQNLPAIISGGVNTLTSFIGGALQILPQLIVTGAQALILFSQGITSQLPNIMQMGMNAITALVQGIVPMIPTLFTTAIHAVVTFAQGTSSMLPQLIQNGAKLLGGIIGGLIGAIPDLFMAIPKIIAAIIEGLFSTDWIQVGKDILSGIWNGLTGGSDEGKAAEAGSNLAASYSAGIDASAFQVQSSVNSMATGIDMTQFTTIGTDGGADMMAGLTQSIDTGNVDVLASFNTGLTDLQTAAEQVDLTPSGKQMMQGLINGMEAKRAEVIAKATSIAQAAANAINNSLEIHSPSRVMEQAGQYTGEGLALGMESKKDAVGAAAVEMASPASSGIKEALSGVISSFGGGGSTTNSSQTSAPVFNFNPTYVLGGGSEDVKSDVAEANKMSMREFERMMNEWSRRNARVSFA